MESMVFIEKEVGMEYERAYTSVEIDIMVEKYGNMVFHLALVKMKQKECADDIFQEVFIKLIKLREKLSNNEHEKAWMIRTTLNCCKDMWKSAWFRRVIYEQQDDKSAECNKAELSEGIYHLVLNLPDKYRIIIHLFYYEDISVKDISVMLKLNMNTVSTRLMRARRILKKELIKEGYNYEI